jgi:rod shape-determining protein MreD
MRWLTFVICAVVFVTLQVTIAPRVEYLGARADWILVLAVFYALNGRSIDVLIGAWILGAVADLFTIERFGVLALSYALAAMLVYGVREYLFREHPLTQFCVTFAACLAIHIGLVIYRFGVFGLSSGSLGELAREPLLASLYTGLSALPVHFVLLRMHGLLGIMPARLHRRRSAAGKSRGHA